MSSANILSVSLGDGENVNVQPQPKHSGTNADADAAEEGNIATPYAHGLTVEECKDNLRGLGEQGLGQCSNASMPPKENHDDDAKQQDNNTINTGKKENNGQRAGDHDLNQIETTESPSSECSLSEIERKPPTAGTDWSNSAKEDRTILRENKNCNATEKAETIRFNSENNTTSSSTTFNESNTCITIEEEEKKAIDGENNGKRERAKRKARGKKGSEKRKKGSEKRAERKKGSGKKEGRDREEKTHHCDIISEERSTDKGQVDQENTKHTHQSESTGGDQDLPQVLLKDLYEKAKDEPPTRPQGCYFNEYNSAKIALEQRNSNDLIYPPGRYFLHINPFKERTKFQTVPQPEREREREREREK